MDPDTPTPNNSPTPQNDTPPVEPTPSRSENTPPSVPPATPPASPPVAPSASTSEPLPQPPQANPELESSSPLPPSPVSPRNNKVLLIVIVVIALIVVGVGIFLAMRLTAPSPAPNSSSPSTPAQTSSTVDASTLTSAVLSTPDSATKGLTKSTGKNPNAFAYTTADQSCLVAYGTATPDFVPNTTVSDFANTYLKGITQNSTNTTITGPSVTAFRLLADATDSNKKYSVPTVRFELAEGVKHGTGLYSLALLKNNTRLIIETLCINEQGNVAQAQMDSMEAIVKQIAVKAN